MINVYECCRKYSIKLIKIEYYKNYIILYSESKKYLLKKKDSSKKELFDYLESIHYDYYLPLINSYHDYYELYPYYEDKTTDKPVKAKEIVSALIQLHLKSVYYESVSLDDLKKIYENLDSRIQYLSKYYLDLQDYIEEFSFPRLDYYFLLLHISKFYQMLRISKEKLDSWFHDENLKLRKCYLIKNVSLDNFRFGDVSYFIDYKECTRDILVYDFASFFRNNVLDVEFSSLFSFYQAKIQFTREEMDLFFTLISIPEKIIFSKSIYNNIVVIRREIDKLDKTLEFVLEEDKKYKKTDK